MLHKPLALAPLLLALALPAFAGGKAEVSFEKPEQFRDIGFSDSERDAVLKTLAAYLGRLASRLPEGQVLQLAVTNIDLAGEERPNAAWREVRVMRGATDWPSIELRYTLREGGRTLKAGEEKLADMGYMFMRSPVELRNDPLVFEKRLLRKWFEQSFATTP